METITLAIVSTDMEYARALSSGLVNEYRDFAIRVTDSRQFVKEWVEFRGKGPYYRQYDLVLWADREGESIYGDNIVWLTDKISETEKDRKGKKFALYKYSPAHVTVSAIFDIYTTLTGRKAVNIRKDSIGVYGVSSWEGGCGCTTLALALGQEMCRFRDSKVMYISLEPMESTGMYFQRAEGCRTTAEYLYRLLREKGSGILPEENSGDIPFLDSYIVRDSYGIEAFAPTRGMNPLCSLKERDMQRLIASIADSGRYDVIIVDMGTCVTEAAIAAGRLADRILCVSGRLPVTAREEQYRNHVIPMARDGREEKIIRVVNKVKGENCEGDGDFRVGENPGIVRGEINEIILEGSFGEDIRKLADRKSVV